VIAFAQVTLLVLQGTAQNTQLHFKQRIVELSDQYNTINALTIIYLLHTLHVSAINYGRHQAILQLQYKR
jgi:hypothetical protein